MVAACLLRNDRVVRGKQMTTAPPEPAAPGHSHDDHGHSHDDHEHDEESGVWGLLNRVFHLHGHGAQQVERATDPAAATSEGIRTVWLALAALSLTTLLQVGIVAWSGSVALLADTVHNFGDALNSVPLLIAFYLSRRPATRRYTYGFGKAEDVAGIGIVLSIAFSAGFILWESVRKLVNPEPIQHIGWVAAAALIGFVGNEAVAWLQIRAGRRIGSAAMVADGTHARIDGITSLAVLIAAGGAALGYPIVDPLIGLLIGIAILFITRDAVTTIWYRLMDAVDPALVDTIERNAAVVQGVVGVHEVRVRWHGHRLYAEAHIVVDEDLSTRESHAIADHVRHTLLQQPYLALVNIHIDPCGHGRHAAA